jgi:hypothetical protein
MSPAESIPYGKKNEVPPGAGLVKKVAGHVLYALRILSREFRIFPWN